MDSNTNTKKKQQAPYSSAISVADDQSSATRPSAVHIKKTVPIQNKDSYRIIGSKHSLYNLDEAFQRNHTVHSRRISREVYLKETNAAQRTALCTALNSVITTFLTQNRSIFLEGLGVLAPVTTEKKASYVIGNFCAVRSEQVRSVVFYKCDDSAAIDRKLYPDIVETAELAATCQLELPPVLCISWLEKDVRRYLRGLLKELKHQLVMKGHCNELESIGLFFALHNRQGDTPADWFAGADIGLRPLFNQKLSVSAPAFFERPVLENSFELLEAAFGKPALNFSVDLPAELAGLGYDLSALLTDTSFGEAKIPVAVFESTANRPAGERVLIYCTDGLRNLGLMQTDKENASGTEIVFQLAVSDNDGIPGSQNTGIPTWVARPIAMAWILLQSSPKKSLRPGAGISCAVPLQPRFDTDLDTIFLTPFAFVPNEVLSREGAFRYINVVGITQEEAAIARGLSQEYLSLLLKHKGLDQVTRSTRTSITKKLELQELHEKTELHSLVAHA